MPLGGIRNGLMPVKQIAPKLLDPIELWIRCTRFLLTTWGRGSGRPSKSLTDWYSDANEPRRSWKWAPGEWCLLGQRSISNSPLQYSSVRISRLRSWWGLVEIAQGLTNSLANVAQPIRKSLRKSSCRELQHVWVDSEWEQASHGNIESSKKMQGEMIAVKLSSYLACYLERQQMKH